MAKRKRPAKPKTVAGKTDGGRGVLGDVSSLVESFSVWDDNGTASLDDLTPHARAWVEELYSDRLESMKESVRDALDNVSSVLDDDN